MDSGITALRSWYAATPAMLADADMFSAQVEYMMSPHRRLSLRERITGWRRFTARSGFTIRLRVTWRATLYDVRHPLQTWRRSHSR